jgi:hypothetical protein
MIVDPKDFSVYTGKLYVVMLVSFAFSGTMSMMQFLHTKPIPDLKQVETTTKTIAPDMGPATTITTVKETHVEPIAPKQDA